MFCLRFSFFQRTLGEFVRPKHLGVVLSVYPADMPLNKFCQIDPNSVTVEDEFVREKVMVAIHAARASALNHFNTCSSSLPGNEVRQLRKRARAIPRLLTKTSTSCALYIFKLDFAI